MGAFFLPTGQIAAPFDCSFCYLKKPPPAGPSAGSRSRPPRLKAAPVTKREECVETTEVTSRRHKWKSGALDSLIIWTFCQRTTELTGSWSAQPGTRHHAVDGQTTRSCAMEPVHTTLSMNLRLVLFEQVEQMRKL